MTPISSASHTFFCSMFSLHVTFGDSIYFQMHFVMFFIQGQRFACGLVVMVLDSGL